MSLAPTAFELCNEYCEVVDQIAGAFIEATIGISGLAGHFMTSEQERWAELARSGRPLTPEDLSLEIVFTGSRDGAPVEHHVTTAESLIRRNNPGGANWHFLAHMCAVAIYGYWEDSFRAQIAAPLQVAKNDLKADEFGELKELRHAVLHNRARGNAKTAVLKILNPIPSGEAITLEPDELLAIANGAKAAARRLVAQFAPRAA